jgi:hypothetical protein
LSLTSAGINPKKFSVNFREEDLADKLMHALQASEKVINARPMPVIEAPKADA